ncbi:hypothetical protein GCN74_21780 [Janthinobacterium sp. FT14W]|uniref:hypothetical protein n=1 Tax=Janthinobacterium sp. FT14W TaxID=2654253 RepID=UPI0012643FAC|nr:hypothetical protein [Janthinobacterium sp. FT14W]KAB8057201.1 hypothetical protein GCN74_21780 [Janthinobacterium sp. FT14W]
MYPDAKRIRSHRVMLRLDDYEHQLVSSIANYQGEELAVLVRQIVMREALAVIALDDSHSDSVQRRSA